MQKDKIVIFSDPLCPFCKDYVPEVIKHVNKKVILLLYIIIIFHY